MSEENIYDPPKSELEPKAQESEDEKYRHILKQLIQQQNMFMGILFGVIGAFFILAGFYLYGGSVPGFIFVLPGVLGGVFIKFFGKPVTRTYRVVPSMCVATMVFLYLGSTSFFAFFLVSINMVIALAVSKRSLSPEQETALYRYKLGKIDL